MWPPMACSPFYPPVTSDSVVWFAEVWASLQPESMDLVIYVTEVLYCIMLGTPKSDVGVGDKCLELNIPSEYLQ